MRWFSMGKSSKANKKVKIINKADKKAFAAIGVIAVLVIGLIIIKLSSGGAIGAESGDLKILKSEVSDTVKFYPYKADRTNMEVLAVLAGDGTVRTAFNTCQVCYDSGRGYYEQEGNELVCQNCGNRFRLDQVELIKGGCNPVPITAEDKTEDDTSIVISQAFLEDNKGLFGNWRK